MADVNEQIAQIKANSNRFTNTAIRGVQGGFVVTGQVQYQDKDTKGIVLTENAEGVASSARDAAQMSLNYHDAGTFDGSAPVAATAPTPAADANPFAPSAI